MSFGCSAGDFLLLANSLYELYNFCQNAPADVQLIVAKVERIAGKLKQFSRILESSGLGVWKQELTLEQSLRDAASFLDPMRIVKHDGFKSKAKGLFRVATKKDQLRNLEKKLDSCEKTIDDMKIDLIL